MDRSFDFTDDFANDFAEHLTFSKPICVSNEQPDDLSCGFLVSLAVSKPEYVSYVIAISVAVCVTLELSKHVSDDIANTSS
tara:strand:+ start:138 stop:380 length:243 start_codon:yes stop_codon:yes gene_type:complete